MVYIGYIKEGSQWPYGLSFYNSNPFFEGKWKWFVIVLKYKRKDTVHAWYFRWRITRPEDLERFMFKHLIAKDNSISSQLIRKL